MRVVNGYRLTRILSTWRLSCRERWNLALARAAVMSVVTILNQYGTVPHLLDWLDIACTLEPLCQLRWRAPVVLVHPARGCLSGKDSRYHCSVPGWYTDIQRRALLDAAAIANLNVLHIINDTTATALGYGITKSDLPEPENPRNIAFLTVKSTAYDPNLSGRDIDYALLNHFAEKFKGSYRIDVMSSANARFRLAAGCEKLKKILSANTEAPLNVESIMNDIDASSKLSREQLEGLIAPLIEAIEAPIQRAIAESGLTLDRIDSAECVGGSTRVPALRNRIQAAFGGSSAEAELTADGLCGGVPLFPIRRPSQYDLHTSSSFLRAPTYKTQQRLSRHYKDCPGQLDEVFTSLLEGAAEPLQSVPKISRVEGASDVAEARNRQPEEISRPPSPIHFPSPPPPSPPPPPPPQPDRSVYPSRSGRQRKRPQRFDDMVPSLLTAVPHMPPPVVRAPSPIQAPSLFATTTTFRTRTSDEQCLDKACDSPGLTVDPDLSSQRWWLGLNRSAGDEDNTTTEATPDKSFAPFPNPSIFRLMSWLHDGNTTKTLDSTNELVKKVILANDFDKEHFRGFSAHREARRLDEAAQSKAGTEMPEFLSSNSWKTGSVTLRLPKEGIEYDSEHEAPTVTVDGVYYRSLREVVKTAFEDESARTFHYTPYRLFHKPTPDAPPERVISELYNSDEFLEEHERLQKQPREPDCDLETGIAGMMLWSDSTHLAQFGNAALWPIYCYFGNQSKYDRAKPTQYAGHHLAYVPDLPDSVADKYEEIYGKQPKDAVMTHLRRELMHAIWELILKDEFVHDYQHGIVVRCADGVTRRLYPRIFTYSADYPEKVLLTTIRFLGGCPCPRCFIKKDQIGAIGTTVDEQRRSHKRQDTYERQFDIQTARRMIFREGRGVNSKAVERLLKPLSQTPTMNAFSAHLSEFGFDYHDIFVPDLLHEVELGTWKAIFAHLVRILHAHGHGSVQMLNKRYRQTPTFGSGTIRKFSANASEMKKLPARDFEDLLQCSMPVFEGLLPEPHNQIVLDLLFSLCHWHALAKLRLHTSSTLASLKIATRNFGQKLRVFIKKTCSVYETRDLPGSGVSQTTRRAFNSSTYKLHAMGDYEEAIWRFGTTDGYSTQIGELEHRRVKRFYARTNKQAGFTAQIAKQQRRQRILRKIGQLQHPSSLLALPHDDEPLMPISPRDHHYISPSQKKYLDVIAWVGKHPNDPALQNFVFKLKNHLLARIRGDPDDTTYPASNHIRLGFLRNRIYHRKRVQINYTTYDLRRSQDTINPDYHADIMVLSESQGEDTGSAYAYARVLRVFHAEVFDHNSQSPHPGPKHTEFLWVRWYNVDTTYSAGFQHRRLPRLRLASGDEAFGFIDPSNIIHAVHLIPGFAHGYDDSAEALGPSIARRKADGEKDWFCYYFGFFADRDLFMRVRGGGIGHKATSVSAHAVDNVTFPEDDLDDDTTGSEEEDIRAEILDYGYSHGVDGGASDNDQTDAEDDEDEWEDADAEQEGYGSFN
ncbi:hypothetical protein NP233_g11763 [Leucocoprinus birnbaumii]|uniref:Uncharacterized protein n=1 Tax=Leucocoprinus birnbaumii TaxID=56174 RepID=A0AAD5VID6_9AGAR|nr:hypothetical protein NP233_g11763 [Leucocoprinus birnbaumii]